MPQNSGAYSGIKSFSKPHSTTPSNFYHTPQTTYHTPQTTYHTAQTAHQLLPPSLPITQSNPWNNPSNKATSEADNWLNSTANRIDPFAAAPNSSALIARSQYSVTTPLPPFNQSHSSLALSFSQASPARVSYFLNLIFCN